MSPSYSIDEVASAYNQWSKTYESFENLTRDLSAMVLRQQLWPLSHHDVLEIGCGTGLNSRYLAQHSKRFLAMDFSAGMLAAARAKVSNPGASFIQRDIRNGWPLAGASVDLVVCSLVLEHIEDLGPIFKEAARVLRPGGEFFVCEYHPFRQLLGSQARFTDEASGDLILIPAYLHDVSDYLNTALENRFEIRRIDEWRDESDSSALPPRLLSLRLQTPADDTG